MSAERPLHLPDDFSDRLPPMLVKELRQGLRAPMFVTPFILVHVLAILAVAGEYQSGAAGGFGSPFWIVTIAVLVFIMPLRGFAALREECEGGNAGLLMLGGLSRWQIVRGKWLVQVVLGGLTFLSLLPYLLVRYFLGGFEILPNLLMAVNVMTMSAGISGCVIGASGYRPVPLRFVVAGIGAFWVLAGGGAVSFLLSNSDEIGHGILRAVFWLIYLCGLGVQALYAITGLQLGRAHLKLYLLPYEVAPTRAAVSLMVFLPFILLAGGIGTLFWGFPLVLAMVLYAMCRYDRPWRPAPGREPRQVTGLDTGWRPMH